METKGAAADELPSPALCFCGENTRPRLPAALSFMMSSFQLSPVCIAGEARQGSASRFAGRLVPALLLLVHGAALVIRERTSWKAYIRISMVTVLGIKDWSPPKAKRTNRFLTMLCN